MTTLSKHQTGTGQGVEFQSRQSHAENYKYKRCAHTPGPDRCEELCMPTCMHAQSHEDTHTDTSEDEECQSWNAAPGETVFFCDVSIDKPKQLEFGHVLSRMLQFILVSFKDSLTSYLPMTNSGKTVWPVCMLHCFQKYILS